jgi:branched-chain amino acid transport system substrate-binding protein
MGERFEDSGSLDGLKGVFDGYEIDEAPEMRARLEAAEPLLTYFGDALEAYDATIAVALAAISAQSDTGSEIRRHLAAVTGQGTVCTTFAACAELLEAGTDIDYDGVSGPLDLGVHGDPLRSVFTVYELSDDGLRYPVNTVIAQIED